MVTASIRVVRQSLLTAQRRFSKGSQKHLGTRYYACPKIVVTTNDRPPDGYGNHDFFFWTGEFQTDSCRYWHAYNFNLRGGRGSYGPAATEAAQVVAQLPVYDEYNLASLLGGPSSKSPIINDDCWTALVFYLAWSEIPGSPLRVWGGTANPKPNGKKPALALLGESELKTDIWTASVYAVDILLAGLAPVSPGGAAAEATAQSGKAADGGNQSRWFDGRWYFKASGEQLDLGTLAKAAKDKPPRVIGKKKPGSNRWTYELESVCNAYPQYRALLTDAAKPAESHR